MAENRAASGDNLTSSTDRAQSFRRILTSSAIVGGSSAANVVIGLVRAKAMALLLGPAGIGLLGVYASITDLARTVAEVGINSSAVRQVAESANSADRRIIGRTVVVLRRLTIALGLIGAIALFVASDFISEITFGNPEHGTAIAILSLVILFRVPADSLGALLQGLRRINEIAKSNVISSILGTILTLIIVFTFGSGGIAPSLVAVAGGTLLISWIYARRLSFPTPEVAPRHFLVESKRLLLTGSAFMASTCATLSAAYIARLIVIRHDGLEAAGLYQAAWALAGTYLAFVLQAMGTDFYPRLVASASNHKECNRIVNEQTLASVLLATTGVIGTVSLAPWALHLLYSEQFGAADSTLRWFCLGMAMRVITWPLGYILIAKERNQLFVLVDVAWTLIFIGLTYIFVRSFGFQGAGIAFFLSYLCHLCMLYPMCRRLTDFRWTSESAQTIVIFALMVGLAQGAAHYFAQPTSSIIGLALLILATVWSFRRLQTLAATSWVPRRVSRLFNRNDQDSSRLAGRSLREDD